MLLKKYQEQLIDINLNRLSEGLKVIEDTIRFCFQNETKLLLIRKIKQKLWHNISAIRKKTILARKSETDLGRSISFDNYKRIDLVDVLIANLKRCQESSRVLEEIFKLSYSRYARFFKNLRFKLYDLEKKLVSQLMVQFDAKIYVILDIQTIERKKLTEIAKCCIAGGATMIQLRETKDTTTKQWLVDAIKIKKAISNSDVKFIINDRIDIVLATNADGVHIGDSDMPLKYARMILGDTKIIGVTVRNVKNAISAEKRGANYISVGAIFPSPTKPFVPIVGLETLRHIIKSVKIPVIAIGGITKDNKKDIFESGANGVAIVSSVFKGIDFNKPGFKKKIFYNLTELINVD